MIKAGYKGSGINDVVYMGDVVNQAAHLAHKAGRGGSHAIWVGEEFGGNLNEENAALLWKKRDFQLGDVRTGDVIWTQMHDWITEEFA